MIRDQNQRGRGRTRVHVCVDKLIPKKSQLKETSLRRDQNARRTSRSLIICWGFSVRSVDTRGVKPNKSPPGASRLISDHTRIFPPASALLSVFSLLIYGNLAGRRRRRESSATDRSNGIVPLCNFFSTVLVEPLLFRPVFGPHGTRKGGGKGEPRLPTVFAKLPVNKRLLKRGEAADTQEGKQGGVKKKGEPSMQTLEPRSNIWFSERQPAAFAAFPPHWSH